MTEDIMQVIAMWKIELLVAVGVLALVVFFMYLSKVWVSHDTVSLNGILGVGLVCVMALYGLLHNRVFWGGSRNLLLFLLLYAWCVLGMLFITPRHVHAAKLIIALLAQAGILYGLYHLV